MRPVRMGGLKHHAAAGTMKPYNSMKNRYYDLKAPSKHAVNS